MRNVVSSKKKGVIRLLEKEDFPKLALYLEQKTKGAQSRDAWLDLFTYWWQTNPALSDTIPIGWVLLTAANEIGGFLGNIPVKYKLNGDDITVCCGTSWFVDDDYRHKSLELLSRFLKQKNPLLNTTPINKVYDIFLKLGFKELSSRWLQKDGIYPVDPHVFWDFFINKKFPDKTFLPVLKIAQPIAGHLIHFMQTIRRTGPKSSSSRFSCREITTFNASYSTLCKNFNQKHSLLALRNQKTLNWFFFGSEKMKGSRRVIEIRHYHKPIGYAGVKLVDKLENNKLFYYYEVVDLVMTQESPEAFYTLFKALAKLGDNSDQKIAFLKLNPFFPGIESHMTRFGFLWQEGKAKYLYKGIEEEPTTSTLYATPLDGDRCFFP